jgi:hypothetical protein
MMQVVIARRSDPELSYNVEFGAEFFQSGVIDGDWLSLTWQMVNFDA